MSIFEIWRKRFNSYTQEYTYLELGLAEQIRRQPYIFPHSGILIRTLSFFKNYILSDGRILNINLHGSGEIRVFCGNNGNENSNLKRIYNIYANGKNQSLTLISVGRTNVNDSQIDLPPKIIFIKVLILFPAILLAYAILLPFSFRYLKYSFDRLLIGVSYYIYFKNIFAKQNPSKPSIKIFISNNNNPISTALLDASSKYKNVSTYYVEHCRYVKNWPQIDTDNYIVCYPHSLGEIPTYWKRKNMYFFPIDIPPRLPKSSVSENCIGLAVCPVDDMSYVISIIKFIQDNFHCKILIRPHPSMTEKKFSIIGNMFKELLIIKPSVVPLDEFFENCSVLLVSDSSIYFDAWSRGVLPLKVQLSSQNSEYTVRNDSYYGIQRQDGRMIDLVKLHIDGSLRERVRHDYYQAHGDASSELAYFSFD